MSLTEIKAEILKYKKLVREKADKGKVMPAQLTSAKPSLIRKHIDRMWRDNEIVELDVKTVTDQLNECIAELEECKTIVQEVGDTIQAMKPILNTATMGTLRGLAKDTMKRHSIKPDKRDKASTSVYRLKYNELEQVSKKGGKTRRRRKQRKN